jgi:hypothetical protein
MSKTETLLLVAGLVFWFAWRLERLGKQLEAVSHLLQLEMAELTGNEERANELREEWREDRAEAKKENRKLWITWGVIGAAALVL